MKKLTIFLSIFLVLIISGCASEQSSQSELPLEKVTIQAPAAPPTAPLLQVIANNPFGDDVELKLVYYKSVEEATTRIVKNEADFTILPVNVAAKLYNKGIDIKLANVSTWGILYLLSADSNIENWSDLKGDELFVGAQGASPDIITRYLLKKNDVNIDELQLKYSSSPEIAQMMIQGLIKTAVLPEPLATKVLSKNPEVKVIKNYQQEWQLVEGKGTGLPQAGMVVQKNFIDKHPEEINKFQQAYRKALKQTVSDPATISKMVEQNFKIPSKFFEQAMTRINLKFATAQEAKNDVDNYLIKLNKLSPDSVGGNLPDEKFYFAE